eukprot:Plantae.Rhodophyta-Rhodochaete_pulchella.ctg18946.p1 GENE.Plantae.Rhodophyta-Rhodochaete_pulchella.ctg18946~~Plantae.Rhodophyta-Rhodochaete_pulchella.ctg18946.p1  ORF type:complete len:946 (-),score=165.63 Plantae.Rhodophyta-Rhodochaete_pulchella.ctg18946:235-2883(-)
MAILPRVQDSVRMGQFERAAEILMSGLDLVMLSPMVRITALEDTRNLIVMRRNTLFDHIISEIGQGVYSGRPLNTGSSVSIKRDPHITAGIRNASSILSKPSGLDAYQTFETDDQESKSRFTEEYIFGLVRALKILGKSEWLTVLESRMPAMLEAVVYQIIDLIVSRQERIAKSGASVSPEAATPSQGADISTFGIAAEWQKRLPSVAAPRASSELCTEILEEVRIRCIHCLHNHVFLLSKSPESDPDFASLKRLWFCIETKAEEVFDVLTIPLDMAGGPASNDQQEACRATSNLAPGDTLRRRKSLRLRQSRTRRPERQNELPRGLVDFEKEYSFLSAGQFPKASGNFSMMTKRSLSRSASTALTGRALSTAGPTSSSGDVEQDDAKTITGSEDTSAPEAADTLQRIVCSRISLIVPSVYNIPSIHGTLQRLAAEGRRIVTRNKTSMVDSTESVQHLNMFCEEAVCVTLFNELWSDLQTAVDLLSGRPHELLRLESLTEEDENSAMPTLPAADGTVEIIAEVIGVATKIPEHARELGKIVSDFLSIFEDKLYISLGVIEQWTVAGGLLEDSSLVGEMQQTLRCFFLESREGGAPPGDLDIRRSVKDRTKLKARYKVIMASVGSMEKEQQQILQADELKALVRLVSSIYHLLRLMDPAAAEHADALGGGQSRTGEHSLIRNLPDVSHVGSPSMKQSFGPSGSATHVSTVVSRQQELQRLKVSKRVAHIIMTTLSPSMTMFQHVAERGLMLLRLEMQARILLHVRDAVCELSRASTDERIEQLGLHLGSDLSSCDRIVKFNLDVAKREYIFFDLDFTMGAFLENSSELLKYGNSSSGKVGPSLAKALRVYVTSARRHCDMLSWGTRSAVNHALDALERSARGL